MKRVLFILFLGLAGLILLAAVGLGVFLAVFNPNGHKERISLLLEEATGRRVQLQGDLELSFFPKPGLKTGKLLVSESEFFGGDPFVTVESALLSLSSEALMQGQLAVEEATLHGARLYLVTNALGRHNWEPQSREGEKKAPLALETSAEKTALPILENARAREDGPVPERFALRLQSMHCRDAVVSYRDMRSERSYTASLDPFSLPGMMRAELPLEISGAIRRDGGGQKLRFSIRAALRATEAGGAISAAVEHFEAQGQGFAPGPFLLKGKVDIAYEGPGEKGLALSGLQGLFSLLPEKEEESGPAPHTGLRIEYSQGNLRFRPGTGLTPARIEGGIELSELDLDALQGRIGAPVPEESQEAVKGAPNLSRPKVGKAHIQPEIARTLDDLHAVRAKQEAGAQAGEKSSAFSWMDAELSLRVGKLRVRSLPLHEVRLEIRSAAAERQAALPFSFKLFKGAVQGKASLRAEKKLFAFSLTTQVQGLDMAEATQTLSGKYSISGLLEASAELAGTGKSVEELLHSLSGKAKAKTGSGEIRGFSLIPPSLPGLGHLPANVPFERLSASAEIKRGVLTSRDILLQSKVLAGRGGGKLHLAYGQMDAGLDFLPAGSPPAVPVSISGPLGALSTSVDLHTFMRNRDESNE